MTILWDYSIWTWSKRKLKKPYVYRKVHIFSLVKSQYSILDLNHLTIFFQGPVAPALFGRSALTVKGSLGETAVGFDFAPPTISTSVSAGEEPSTNPTIYPVFILWGDGRIYFVTTTIGKVIHPKCSKDSGSYNEFWLQKNGLFISLFKDSGENTF